MLEQPSFQERLEALNSEELQQARRARVSKRFFGSVVTVSAAFIIGENLTQIHNPKLTGFQLVIGSYGAVTALRANHELPIVDQEIASREEGSL